MTFTYFSTMKKTRKKTRERKLINKSLKKEDKVVSISKVTELLDFGALMRESALRRFNNLIQDRLFLQVARSRR